jgi:hypothetical protein
VTAPPPLPMIAAGSSETLLSTRWTSSASSSGVVISVLSVTVLRNCAGLAPPWVVAHDGVLRGQQIR